MEMVCIIDFLVTAVYWEREDFSVGWAVGFIRCNLDVLKNPKKFIANK